MNTLVASVAVILLLTGQHPQMPAGMSHEEHLKQMQKDEALKKRGAEAMGFDQDATTHHFRLSATGGSIEVTARDEADRATVDAIRAHLRSIAGEFATGRFDKPLQTHGEVPPGADDMQKLREKIAYRFDELPGGGAVRIETNDRRALDAVHAFLRYQIAEHHTGDSMQLKR
jgi:hypothetical protein